MSWTMGVYVRVGIAVLAALAAASASTAPGSAQNESATAVPCARPNVAPQTLRAVAPDTPPMVRQQGISGTVRVIISLDEQSRVTAARVYSSPSAILNAPALAAARASTFQTEVRNCRPVAADYVFSVSFDAGGGAYRIGRSGTGEPTITVTTQGVTHRPAELAVVSVSIVIRDADPAIAASRNVAIYTALRARLRGLGIDDDKVRMTYTYSATPLPTATPAPLATGASTLTGPYTYRQVVITAEPAARVAAVVEAATAVGATSISGVRYDIHDREGAYREALANGLKDAQARADVIAATAHMRLGPVQDVQNRGTPNVYTYASGTSFPVGAPLPAGMPSPVEVRADVTVTYLLLKP